MQAISHTAFDHPDFVFAVDDLDDALYEQLIEKPANAIRILCIFTGEDKARNGCRFVEQIALGLLDLGSLLSCTDILAAKSSTDVAHGIAHEALCHPTA